MLTLKLVIPLAAIVFASSSYAIPAGKLADDEAKEVANNADVRSFIGRISEHIGKSIERRERDGSLKDENDALAIMLSSVTKLREEIEEKTGVNLEEQTDEVEHPGMPKGMKDVNPTGASASSAIGILATSLPILLASPETLRSLNDKVADDSTFQDYMKLAEGQDPELRRQSTEAIRRKTIEMMRSAFKMELKKLAFVFAANWAQSLQKQAAAGSLAALILYQIQALVMRRLIDLVVDALAHHSAGLAHRVSEFARTVGTNQPHVAPTGARRPAWNTKSLADEDDRGQWMLHYMFD